MYLYLQNPKEYRKFCWTRQSSMCGDKYGEMVPRDYLRYSLLDMERAFGPHFRGLFSTHKRSLNLEKKKRQRMNVQVVAPPIPWSCFSRALSSHPTTQEEPRRRLFTSHLFPPVFICWILCLAVWMCLAPGWFPSFQLLLWTLALRMSVS